jgi:alkylated DNA nucleotide flippase Atl1
MAGYGSDVPWWRVIRSSGLPPIAHEERARPHYEAEATPLVTTVDGYKVNLRLARYLPE